MPIQNVGTLLENLVVTEASTALLSFCDRMAPFEFVNAFAMPPLSPWRPHAQNVGFDPDTLNEVRSECGSLGGAGEAYPALLRASLNQHPSLGPNAALLVAAACLNAGVPCRMWLNDIRDGHYGDALPELEKLATLAAALCGMKRDAVSDLSVHVSDVDYPDSILELAKVLRTWQPPGGCRLGFLDPMRYRVQGRHGPETSSEDHRRRLRQIAFDGLTCAVHFTGHSDHPSLERELRSLTTMRPPKDTRRRARSNASTTRYSSPYGVRGRAAGRRNWLLISNGASVVRGRSGGGHSRHRALGN